MSENRVGEVYRRQGKRNVGLVSFMGIVFGGHAVGAAIFVCVAGAIFDCPIHSLLLPYVVFLCPGLVLAPLLYRARLSREHARPFALQCGLAMLVYSQAIILALAFGTIRLRILSQEEAISDFGLLVIPVAVFVFWVSYKLARQMPAVGRLAGEDLRT